MEKIFVCGGSGFLGSHVVRELVKRGYDVTILDRRPPVRLSKDTKFVGGDILDRKFMEAALDGAEIVYNFAGLADINEAKDKPIETADANITGNLNVLEAAHAAGARRFVYASTVYVCGDHGSFYGVTKQASERFVELYQERFNLEFTILRYGSLYGRCADRSNTIRGFIEQARTNGKIEYIGTGEELREYIHVEDAAKLSVDILSAEYANSHVVVTGHQQMRVKDVMAMIAEVLDPTIQLEFGHKEHDAHYRITPYTYKPRIGRKLTANPFIDMGQGILDLVHELSHDPHRQDRTLTGEIEL